MERTIWSVLLGLLLLPFATHANDELLKLQKDPSQWVMQRKNYAATGYSELNQITAANVKHLKAAWTSSTGVLRGHEGAPLIVGTTMYVHTPFPNTIYALDLTKQPYAIKWSYTPQQNQRAVPVACCDTVHRGVNYVEGKVILPTLDVRELQNVIERAVILSPGPVLRLVLDELPRRRPASGSPAKVRTLEEVEREHILRVLQDTHGVIGGPHGAAVRLGLRRTTLLYRLEKFGISRQPS
jgi:Bacterial regulatory protein, Fis family